MVIRRLLAELHKAGLCEYTLPGGHHITQDIRQSGLREFSPQTFLEMVETRRITGFMPNPTTQF